MENIVKTFPGVMALDHAFFELKPGQVHILLGENGAGKSTLMKILCGAYQKDSGKIFIKSKEVEIGSVHKAQELGIGIVYQELNLIHSLTVAENIFLGRQPTVNGSVDWKEMNRQTQSLLNDLGMNINPKAMVGEMSVAMQQMVEVAKAISLNIDVLIMDEPTSSLGDKEIEDLYRIIRRLKARGVGIVYISHRMEELKEIGDAVSVYRDGQYIQTLEITPELDMDELIKLMVGRDISEQYPKKIVPITDEILRVEGISDGKFLKNCSFRLRKGEILGFSGLVGAGRTELMRAVTGVDPKTAGKVFFCGNEVQINSFRDAINLGIGFLTEDRKGQGLVLGMSARENMTLVGLQKILRMGNIDYKKEREVAVTMIEDLAIKVSGPEQQVVNLSGGNQQKVVLAKWLFADCDVLIFDEPTRGIDVGAKVEIYKIIGSLAERGVGVIVVSSDLPEILGICDRVIVMHEGTTAADLDIKEATQELVMTYATGGRGKIRNGKG